MTRLSLGESVELIHLISGVNRQLEQLVEARLKPTGIPIEQYRVLSALNQHSGLPMGELASTVFVDAPTLTKIVDRMVANAHVYRAPDPADRRRVLIFMSETGRKLFDEIHTILESTKTGLIDQFDRREAGHLRSLLENILTRR